jgi:hypothetical protein
MRVGKNLKRGGCEDEREKDQSTNPGDEREQHEEAKE